MKLILALAVLLFLLLSLRLSQAAEMHVEGGPDVPLFSKEVPEASLRMLTVQNKWYALYYGEIERMVKVQADVQVGEETGTFETEIPVRFGFFGMDVRVSTKGTSRLETGLGLVMFDKQDPKVDGTLWRVHWVGYWIIEFGDVMARLGAHHFSNGEDIVGSPGPNFPMEFITLSVGARF